MSENGSQQWEFFVVIFAYPRQNIVIKKTSTHNDAYPRIFPESNPPRARVSTYVGNLRALENWRAKNIPTTNLPSVCSMLARKSDDIDQSREAIPNSNYTSNSHLFDFVCVVKIKPNFDLLAHKIFCVASHEIGDSFCRYRCVPNCFESLWNCWPAVNQRQKNRRPSCPFSATTDSRHQRKVAVVCNTVRRTGGRLLYRTRILKVRLLQHT